MKYIISTMRPNFLPLAFVCAFLGMAVAIWQVGAVNPLHTILAYLGAIAAHACVNAVNDYLDTKSGLDLRTNRTPFSGGSGTFVSEPAKLHLGLVTVVGTALVVVAIGIYFTLVIGWQILVIGVVGLLVIFAYTPWFNKQPILCLLAPGIGFGPLIVLGTYYVLTGQVTFSAVLASLVPLFLVSNLLLLNQFPDVEADQTVARRHFPILIGRKASATIFAAFNLAAFLVILVGVIIHQFPAWVLLGLTTIILAIPAVKGALQHPDDIPRLMPSLGQNVLVNLVTPLLMGIGLLIS